MKKQYFVRFGSFGNTYSLRWADTAEGVQSLARMGYERINRAEAVRLARAERRRRREDPACSCFADSCIFPADYNAIDYCSTDDLSIICE